MCLFVVVVFFSISSGYPDVAKWDDICQHTQLTIREIDKANSNPNNWCVLVVYNSVMADVSHNSLNDSHVHAEWGDRSSSDVLLVYAKDRHYDTFYLLWAIRASDELKKYMPLAVSNNCCITSDMLQNATFVNVPTKKHDYHYKKCMTAQQTMSNVDIRTLHEFKYPEHDMTFDLLIERKHSRTEYMKDKSKIIFSNLPTLDSIVDLPQAEKFKLVGDALIRINVPAPPSFLPRIIGTMVYSPLKLSSGLPNSLHQDVFTQKITWSDAPWDWKNADVDETLTPFQIICATRHLMSSLGQDRFWNSPDIQCTNKPTITDMYERVTAIEQKHMNMCFESPRLSTWLAVEDKLLKAGDRNYFHMYKSSEKDKYFSSYKQGYMILESKPSVEAYLSERTEILYSCNIWHSYGGISLFTWQPGDYPRLLTCIDRSHSKIFNKLWAAAVDLPGNCLSLCNIPEKANRIINDKHLYNYHKHGVIHHTPIIGKPVYLEPGDLQHDPKSVAPVWKDEAFAPYQHPQLKKHIWGLTNTLQRAASIFAVYENYAYGVQNEMPLFTLMQQKIEMAASDPRTVCLQRIDAMVEREFIEDKLYHWSALVEYRDSYTDYISGLPVKVLYSGGNIQLSTHLVCLVRVGNISRPFIFAHIPKDNDLITSIQQTHRIDNKYFEDSNFNPNYAYNIDIYFKRHNFINQFEILMILSKLVEEKTGHLVDQNAFEKMKWLLVKQFRNSFYCPCTTLEGLEDWARENIDTLIADMYSLPQAISPDTVESNDSTVNTGTIDIAMSLLQEGQSDTVNQDKIISEFDEMKQDTVGNKLFDKQCHVTTNTTMNETISNDVEFTDRNATCLDALEQAINEMMTSLEKTEVDVTDQSIVRI